MLAWRNFLAIQKETKNFIARIFANYKCKRIYDANLQYSQRLIATEIFIITTYDHFHVIDKVHILITDYTHGVTRE